MGRVSISLFPNEDILTKEIETWRGFIEKLPIDEDKAILTELLNDCYKYSVAMNNQAQVHPFTTESLIMSLLLSQHKIINHLKSMVQSEHSDNEADQQQQKFWEILGRCHCIGHHKFFRNFHTFGGIPEQAYYESNLEKHCWDTGIVWTKSYACLR